MATLSYFWLVFFILLLDLQVGFYKSQCFFVQLLEGNFALFCSSTLGFRDDFQNILLVVMVSTIPRFIVQQPAFDEIKTFIAL